jgi:hypothetical protein
MSTLDCIDILDCIEDVAKYECVVQPDAPQPEEAISVRLHFQSTEPKTFATGSLIKNILVDVPLEPHLIHVTVKMTNGTVTQYSFCCDYKITWKS